MKRGAAAFALIFLLGAIRVLSASAFDWTNPSTWPVIPVPEIATDPNGGTTVGVLPVMLFTDSKNQITDILAPDINWNTTLGPGGTFRYLAYPSEDESWYAVAGGNEIKARKVDLDYQVGRTHQDLWTLEGRLYWENDPTERFYGIGNNSAKGNQTNYMTKQLYLEGIAGLNITPNLQLQFMERPKWIQIANGAFTSLPNISALFPPHPCSVPRAKNSTCVDQIYGLNGGREWLSQLMLQYDNRDSVDIPRSGGLYRIYGAIADQSLGSTASYTRFGGEIRKYLTVTERITFAGHAFIEYEPAGNPNSEMPFWAQARLGGDESLLTDQETLRGFGAGRYVDLNLSVANLEMRTRVFDADLFGTHGTLELAPFVEAGRVSHDLGYNPASLSALHGVGGVGFRAIAQPFVVGFVDLGYGGEGAAVFSGINYPF